MLLSDDWGDEEEEERKQTNLRQDSDEFDAVVEDIIGGGMAKQREATSELRASELDGRKKKLFQHH